MLGVMQRTSVAEDRDRAMKASKAAPEAPAVEESTPAPKATKPPKAPKQTTFPVDGDTEVRMRPEEVNTKGTVTNPASPVCANCGIETVRSRLVAVKNSARSNKRTAVCVDCGSKGSHLAEIKSKSDAANTRIQAQPTPEKTPTSLEAIQGDSTYKVDPELREVAPEGMPTGLGALAIGMHVADVPERAPAERGLGTTPESVRGMATKAIGHSEQRAQYAQGTPEWQEHHDNFTESHAKLTRVAPKVADLVAGVAHLHTRIGEQQRKLARLQEAGQTNNAAQAKLTIKDQTRLLKKAVKRVHLSIDAAAAKTDVVNKGTQETKLPNGVIIDGKLVNERIGKNSIAPEPKAPKEEPK
jgi:hypothetical protein